jgi:hypothetical protein
MHCQQPTVAGLALAGLLGFLSLAAAADVPAKPVWRPSRHGGRWGRRSYRLARACASAGLIHSPDCDIDANRADTGAVCA